ncbi:MAG: signal recognition particle protein, partial [Actinotalea sp.]|nr:signal recognition particle protein [Actinotalea sp.]
MARGAGLPGMGGMGRLPGMGGKKSRGRMAPQQRKAKGKSGNPAKRAQQEREAAERAAGKRPAGAPGSAFGLDRGPSTVDPSSLELPPGLDKFLGR